MTALAFVRGVPASFSRCVTAAPPDPPLDVEVAREQHSAYVAALEGSGYRVVPVPVDDESPDSPFVEDTAIVIGDRVLVTRPGHPSRRSETGPVGAVLAEHLPVHHMKEPATLDGGDVLVVGRRILVGLSGRTNHAGVRAVAAIAEPQGFSVTAVPVKGVLHLKSALSAVDDSTVLWHPQACERDALEGLDVIEVGGDDPEAANVVRLADGGVLVSSAHDATAETVEARDMPVRRVDVGEFGRADGGLTCLSIRVR